MRLTRTHLPIPRSPTHIHATRPLPPHTHTPPPAQVYDAQKGGFSDVGMLDVQQIFGRAGRPQFEDSGGCRCMCMCAFMCMCVCV